MVALARKRGGGAGRNWLVRCRVVVDARLWGYSAKTCLATWIADMALGQLA
jgi:hypothetical protein